MARSPRLAVLLLVPALAFGAAACGVSAGEEGSSLVVDGAAETTAPAPEGAPSTTEPSDDPTTTTDEAPPSSGIDAMVDAYEAMGFTEEEATCLAEQIDSQGGNFDPGDATGMMDIINQCDISLSRMMDLTEQLGNGDPEVAMRESLAAGFMAGGLSEEDADCVAGAFVDQFGVDASAAADPSALMGLFEACGVDPSSFGN